MKKTQFEGLDFAVVDKFKAPIEKFNTNDDLQNWAEKQIDMIKDHDFGGRQEETKIQRKAMLKEWLDYVLKENDAYNSATALLILNAVIKDLKADNDDLPPVLNKGVLADCISEIDKNVKADKNYHFDLNKMYKTKLRTFYLDDTKTENGATGWVVIPSKIHDPENFDENVEKLKALSHKNWCTKSFNAKPYLSDGDFHVYLENGEPKLGVRFVNDAIQEIQGPKNNGKIPFAYADEVENHIAENKLKLHPNARNEIKALEQIKKEVNKIKLDLKDAIEKEDAKAIYEYFGMSPKETKDGLLSLSKYQAISDKYSFEDIGIDENKLFKNVESIREDADFSSSQITNLSNLKNIGRNAYFKNSQVTNLGNLKSIGGDAYFSNSQVTELGNLKSIGEDAYFSDSQVTELGNLKSIGGSALFTYSQVTDLGNLQSIGGNALFSFSHVTDLGNLEFIGKDADFRDSQVKYLGKLKSIGRNAYFETSQITSLNNLKSIGKDADFSYSKVIDLGDLEYIGKNAYFSHSQVRNLCKLKSIGGDADFRHSKVIDLGDLEYIGKNAYFNKSQVRNLGKLKSIDGCAFICRSLLNNNDRKKLKKICSKRIVN